MKHFFKQLCCDHEWRVYDDEHYFKYRDYRHCVKCRKREGHYTWIRNTLDFILVMLLILLIALIIVSLILTLAFYNNFYIVNNL